MYVCWRLLDTPVDPLTTLRTYRMFDSEWLSRAGHSSSLSRSRKHWNICNASRVRYVSADTPLTTTLEACVPLSQATKELALIRAGHRCQCRRSDHEHRGRCQAELTAGDRVYRRRLVAGGDGGYTYATCEVVCRECDSVAPELEEIV